MSSSEEVLCALCGRGMDDLFANYPDAVCRSCDARAVNHEGRTPTVYPNYDTGDAFVFIDGIRCWRRYRFGGWITMIAPELWAINPVLRSDLTDPEIRFYSARAQYGFLSNFYPARFRLDGHWWPTVEHFFQAYKSTDASVRRWVRRARSPAAAKKRGRRLRPRGDWDTARIHVMRRALYGKFEQHKKLAERLMETRDALLIEAAPRDSFWGEGPDGHGDNMLGRLLMEVRDELLRQRLVGAR